jgi:hypothetical protein
MRRRTSPWPSPTWRAFLHAHLRETVAVDFFLVPTLTFRLLFVFVVLRHDRRELLHVNITEHPTAVWTARQIIEAFPDDTAPAYLLRDRDRIYGEKFGRRVQAMGIREVRIAPRAPWQNPFVERVIGSIFACLRGLLQHRTSPPSALQQCSTATRDFGRHASGGWSRSRRSAGSITTTPASPDRGRSAGRPSRAL